jgi:hypothetical protein
MLGISFQGLMDGLQPVTGQTVGDEEEKIKNLKGGIDQRDHHAEDHVTNQPAHLSPLNWFLTERIAIHRISLTLWRQSTKMKAGQVRRLVLPVTRSARLIPLLQNPLPNVVQDVF